MSCLRTECPALYLDIGLTDTRLQYGKGFRKLNSGYLRNEEFTLNFNWKWEYWVNKKQEYSSALVWREISEKPEVKTYMDSFSCQQSQARRNTFNSIPKPF